MEPDDRRTLKRPLPQSPFPLMKDGTAATKTIPPQQRFKIPETTYQYTNICDLKEGISNVYGVVTIVGEPKKSSRGTCDWSLNFNIVDPTSDYGLSINVFAEEESKLPLPLEVGDVIRLHRIKISSFNGKIQGVGTKDMHSFLVISGATGIPQSVSKTVTFTVADKERIEVLKVWWESKKSKFTNVIPPAPPPPAAKNRDPVIEPWLRKLSEIGPNQFVDVVVQVIKVGDIEGMGNSSRISLMVFDGSGEKRPLPQPGPPIRPPEHFQEKQILFSPFISLGIQVPVVMWCQSYFPQCNQNLVGKFLRLFNVQSKYYDGVLELKCNDRSRFSILSFNDPSVQDTISTYREQWLDWCNRTEIERSLTTTDHNGINTTCLRDIKTCDMPQKFRCLARVKGYSPTLQDFTLAHCSKCLTTSPSQTLNCPSCGALLKEHVYMFQLRLEDATDTLDAIVCKEDGETFFEMLPASNLYNVQSSYLVLSRMMERLMADPNPINCCIKTYFNKSGKRMYRMFGTRIESSKMLNGHQ
eukprot:TRINITY_DN8460_c0_g1_i1.p1 TRINITY_DN8460_c0_g1~~TRINITY_DN8460_c0_g1_i1.p1  ORF type:complete len:527 (-),score=153.31 TRINITY_DN8460_c0_g1_i1:61-1641(-)